MRARWLVGHDAGRPRGQAKLLQRLEIELERHRRRRGDEARRRRPIEIGLVGVLVVALFGRELVLVEAAFRDIGVELLRIGRAAAVRAAVGAAEARQRADAGRALVVDDVVRVAARIARRAVVGDEARQLEPRAEIEQHALERAHVAVGRDHRLADRVRRRVGGGDRPVEQRDAVPALQIGGVGQDQVGVGDHLRIIGVGVDDLRDAVFAGGRIGGGQMLEHRRNVHG